VNGVFAAAVRVGTGLAETSALLAPATAGFLSRLEVARIEIRAATEVPKALGKGDDARALGVAVDRIAFE